MKTYYTPEFARQVEQTSKRHQNIVKVISRFVENNELNAILNNARIAPHLVREPDVYRFRLEEVSILGSLKTDHSGRFWIFSQLEGYN